MELIKGLRARLTIPEVISLRLVIGLAICIACLRIFYELIEEVFTENEFGRLDLAIANQLHMIATPGATSFFLLVTALGFQVVLVIAVVVGLYFAWKRKWLRLGVWIAALAGGEILNLLLKTWFVRPRPTFADPLATALYYSFPSGHATMSLITYGLLAYFLYRNLPRAWLRIVVSAALILLILLIGFSRLYLGVHYFSDVLAGYTIGTLWLSFCITSMGFWTDRQARHARKMKTSTDPTQ